MSDSKDNKSTDNPKSPAKLRIFYVPQFDVSVKAISEEDAVSKAKKLAKKSKEDK